MLGQELFLAAGTGWGRANGLRPHQLGGLGSAVSYYGEVWQGIF